MTIVLCFGLSAILLVISLSLKTVVISLRVLLKTAEVAGGAIASRVNGVIDSGDGAVSGVARTTRDTARAAVNTVRVAGEAAKKTAKTAGTAIKKTARASKTVVKVGKKVTQLSTKAIKLLIRALQAIIRVIQAVVSFLLSLGIVGIIILVVIILFVLATIAGALSVIHVSPEGAFTAGGEGVSLLGGATGGSFSSSSQTQTGFRPSSGPITSGDTAALYRACQTMAEWYIANVPTYAGTTTNECKYVVFYDCPLVPCMTQGVGDECGRFAAAYGAYVSGRPIYTSGGIASLYNGHSSCEAANFKLYTMNEIGGVAGLQPGDIMLCSDMVDPCSKGGHAEVYLAPNTTFGWGKIQSTFPSNRSVLSDWTCEEHGDLYVKVGTNGHRYGRVWRYVGG